jgi:hypothetical protein
MRTTRVSSKPFRYVRTVRQNHPLTSNRRDHPALIGHTIHDMEVSLREPLTSLATTYDPESDTLDDANVTLYSEKGVLSGESAGFTLSGLSYADSVNSVSTYDSSVNNGQTYFEVPILEEMDHSKGNDATIMTINVFVLFMSYRLIFPTLGWISHKKRMWISRLAI